MRFQDIYRSAERHQRRRYKRRNRRGRPGERITGTGEESFALVLVRHRAPSRAGSRAELVKPARTGARPFGPKLHPGEDDHD